MALNYVRKRNTAIAVKAETTSGVSAFQSVAPDPNVDFLRAEYDITLNQDQITVPEVAASLDSTPPIPGGTKAQVVLTVLMRGSGTPATPPRWGTLLKACSFKETIVAAAIGAPTAATAGTASTATLQTPFAATSELYRGAPVILTGNPTGPFESFITDYTAGRVATFSHTFSPVLSTSTLVRIPAHVKYEPTSDITLFQTVTIRLYVDGLLMEFTGCSGTFTIDLPTAGIGQFKFTFTGVYNAPTSTTMPTGVIVDSATPPVFRNGVCRIGGSIARTDRFSLDAGVALAYPENPEAPEGYDASINTGRNITGNISPLMSVTDTIARVTTFKAGTQQSIAAGWGEVAGNSLGLVIPLAQYTSYSPANRNDLMADNLPFAAIGQDSGLYITQF